MPDSQPQEFQPHGSQPKDSRKLDTWNDGAGANPYDPPPSSIVEPRKKYWLYALVAAFMLLLVAASFFVIATSSTEDSVVIPDVQVYDSMTAD